MDDTLTRNTFFELARAADDFDSIPWDRKKNMLVQFLRQRRVNAFSVERQYDCVAQIIDDPGNPTLYSITGFVVAGQVLGWGGELGWDAVLASQTRYICQETGYEPFQFTLKTEHEEPIVNVDPATGDEKKILHAFERIMSDRCAGLLDQGTTPASARKSQMRI